MGLPGPSTPCSPAHARGQDKGIGNYSPDSFILPAVLRLREPWLGSRGGWSTPLQQNDHLHATAGFQPARQCGLAGDRGVSTRFRGTKIAPLSAALISAG